MWFSNDYYIMLDLSWQVYNYDASRKGKNHETKVFLLADWTLFSVTNLPYVDFAFSHEQKNWILEMSFLNGDPHSPLMFGNLVCLTYTAWNFDEKSYPMVKVYCPVAYIGTKAVSI